MTTEKVQEAVAPVASQGQVQEQHGDKPKLSHLRKLSILLVMNTVSLVQAFDATCICVVLPSLARELNASFSESLSMGSVFLLATAIAQPIFAEIAHVVGRRPAYIAALVIFILGTVLCGTAASSIMLLAGRAVQGIGSGGPQALSGMIHADLFAIRERSRWMAYQNISWALGTIAGPLIGGAVVENKDSQWRWIFWCTLPFLGSSLIGGMFLLGYDKEKRNLRLIKNLDWVGIFLYIIASVSLLLPLTWGGSRFPWKSAAVIVPLIISILAFIGLGFYEKTTKRPMFRKSMFRHRSTVLQFASATIHGILMWMVLYYLAVYFLGIKGQSPLMTGVWALPATITVAPMAAVVGFVACKTGRYMGFLLGGWALLVIMLGVMTILDKDTPTWVILVITLFLGIAMGLLIPVMNIGVQATVDEEGAGHAISMIYVLRTMGQCMGIAIGIAVFSVQLEKELGKMGLDTAQISNALKMIKASVEQGSLGQHEHMMNAVAKALQCLWMTGSLLAGLALILCLFARCPKLPEDSDAQVRAETTPESRFSDTAIGRAWYCFSDKILHKATGQSN
ncbi:major facilitator superfamily domain-containing protein [Fusarium redolens]|uniref:Major facilitator superfamily domain-containing protein n=1 Tax=Fusarium redolens TaxID=48865 RepID=A0A9P9HR24_FUSRE|nr:major facilitator superfamily domain-containing protein [Fusarium redolens]KAH7261247.1 major facilitator superfamily domain-containing protein [Fusarium redolens]